jgi:hypothetical protein
MSGDLIPLSRPFNSIAIAASGGGFRAASFTLGTLSYLNQVKQITGEGDTATEDTLLDHVDFMGSASGGTITTAYFTWRYKEGDSFDQIYHALYNAMRGDLLLKDALNTLNDDYAWSSSGDHKRRNLINAFAKTYDKLLFKGNTWDTYWNTGKRKTIEVCFNTTEFRRGLSFRFQTDGDATTWEQIGNKFTRLSHKHLATTKQIKLGDMLAASSCFPGGFEPILFPDDFAYADKTGALTIEALAQATEVEHYDKTITPLQPKQRIGLMDGGIADNQGLASTLLADERRRRNADKRSPFDLILVTDVASYYMDTYQVPETGELKGWQKKSIADLWLSACRIPKKITWACWIAFILFAASIAGSFLLENMYAKMATVFMAGITLTILVAAIFLRKLPRKLGISAYLKPDYDLVSLLKKNIPTIKHFSDPITRELIFFLKETKIGLLRQMLMSRVRSVLLMVADINLKHVRRLIFGDFYKDKRWDDRRCANFIYELSEQNKEARSNALAKEVKDGKLSATEASMLHPSAIILQVAERARRVGTTLWYDENNDQELKDTVACGQFSTCVNLLQYIMRLENNKSVVITGEPLQNLKRIRVQLEKDWAQFQLDPYWLWSAYKIGGV